MALGSQRPNALIGQVVGGYILREYIGAGATGLVFRGEREAGAPEYIEKTGLAPMEYPTDAAIKLLIPPVSATQEELDEFQRRFLREARTLKSLDHPHILRLVDVGEDTAAGYVYMTLRYMAGGSLAKAIAQRGPLPLAEVANVLTAVGSALDYAHGRNIVHRDVKPGNILLDAAGVPYLADFSIVRITAEGATELTTTGRVMGTPAYMAPEQFDDSRRVGPSADIYGLGMVAYEMVTGHVAFGATSWAQVMKRQLQEPPASPRASRADLPEPAAMAIVRALGKDPAQRFASATEFAEAFALGLHGQWAAGMTRFIAPAPGALLAAGGGVAANALTQPGWPATPPAPLTPTTRRRTRLGLLAAAVSLLLTVSCVGGVAFAEHGNPLALFAPLAQATNTSPATNRVLPTDTTQPTAAATATHAAAKPTATPKKKAQPTSAPIQLPTAAPIGPQMSFSPQDPTGPCNGTTFAAFTLKNVGDQPLSYAVSSGIEGDAYTYTFSPSPGSGTLNPGQQQVVTLTIVLVQGSPQAQFNIGVPWDNMKWLARIPFTCQ
ncbi:MAG TPA: protein kinase [Ktedonobacterales bacterium]|nr:protein kinase [Ktedonobacterales bacterium]